MIAWLSAIVQASSVRAAARSAVVVRHAHHAHPVDDLVEREPVGARVLGDDDDVVAGRGLRLGEGVHVATEAAVDQRRVLPRQMQHAHG